MQFIQKQKPKRISNVEKNFIYQCQICFEDYDLENHVPMIVCSNYHAVCSQCVKQNLFKMEYNAQKNPTGRYMCSKCSEIIEKNFIREHTILKEVCCYIQNIKKKDEEMKKQFYHYVGSMGMSLVAMRSDFDAIEKNNIMLQKQIELTLQQNKKLRNDFERIEKAKGSLQELEKISRQVDEIKQTLELEKVKLFSLHQQINKKDSQLKLKKDQVIEQTKKFFNIQSQIRECHQQYRILSRKNKELLQQNEGAINLRQYLQQQIHGLQLQKKKIVEENNLKKIRLQQGLKQMEKYWQNVINSDISVFSLECVSTNTKQQVLGKNQIYEGIATKSPKKLVNKQMKIEKFEGQKDKYISAEVINKFQDSVFDKVFDKTEKFIRNFYVEDTIVTLNNPKLSSFVHISFEEPFNWSKDHSFTVKLRKIKSGQIMIGLMTKQCKNRKDIYNRKGFYAVDAYKNSWIDGESNVCEFIMRENDEITVRMIAESRSIIWSTSGAKHTFSKKFVIGMCPENLYPVVLLIENKDSFQVLDFN